MEQDTLIFIKEHTGVSLDLCDHFVGVRDFRGRKYFNAVLLDQRVSESQDFVKLQKFASKYKLINFEPAGFKRIAIFIN